MLNQVIAEVNRNEKRDDAMKCSNVKVGNEEKRNANSDEDEDMFLEEDSMGFAAEERRLHESIDIDDTSVEHSASSQESRSEEHNDNEKDSLPPDDSSTVFQLNKRIEKMQHQNEVNIERLCQLECERETKSRALLDLKKKLEECQKQNVESQKELKIKKKFVFKM